MGISKSKFVAGLSCEKRLFLEVNNPELKTPLSANQEAKFALGHRIGALSQERFSGGVNAEPENKRDFQAWIESTREFIANDESVIYEAAFSYEGSFCALDILLNQSGNLTAIEVKSGGSKTDTYVKDAAFQYFVMSQAGYTPKRFYLLLINGEYVRKDKLDVQQLFKTVDITEDVLALQNFVANNLSNFQALLNTNVLPSIGIGPHCSEPYDCPFYGHCSAHLPVENPITDLIGSSKKVWELYNQGVMSMEDIPENFNLTIAQQSQVNGVKRGTSVLKLEPIQNFIEEVTYPLHFFDFETLWPAIPLADGLKPYGHLSFQYSLHIVLENGEIEHREYLADPDLIFQGINTEYDLIQQMKKDFGPEGSIVAFNKSFEETRIRDMIKRFPQESNFLNGILSRFVDLMSIFRSLDIYYLPAMKGSYSIKYVLPAIDPAFSYSDLEIGNGGDASSIFASKAAGNFEGDWSSTREALLKYCERDTYGMVVIWNHLKSLIQ
ncbi:MAG: hypothetical protein RIR06_1908 [Bacteroidota bacterium]|jgi:hypothetical protein